VAAAISSVLAPSKPRSNTLRAAIEDAVLDRSSELLWRTAKGHRGTLRRTLAGRRFFLQVIHFAAICPGCHSSRPFPSLSIYAYQIRL